MQFRIEYTLRQAITSVNSCKGNNRSWKSCSNISSKFQEVVFQGGRLDG